VAVPVSPVLRGAGTAPGRTPRRREVRALTTLLLILLVLLLVGALPAWPYSGGWGYYPSGALGVILLVVLVLFLSGRL
jgi:hypothetical protein